MQIAFDRTETFPAPLDAIGSHESRRLGYVRSSIDWCTRCSIRLVGLNPKLSAERALDLAHELAMVEEVRAKSPERVAEDLLRAVD